MREDGRHVRALNGAAPLSSRDVSKGLEEVRGLTGRALQAEGIAGTKALRVAPWRKSEEVSAASKGVRGGTERGKPRPGCRTSPVKCQSQQFQAKRHSLSQRLSSSTLPKSSHGGRRANGRGCGQHFPGDHGG